MKVKRNTLLLLACLVWGAAGFNILRIGLAAYPAYRSALNFLLSILVFSVFQIFIFGRLVKKHSARIGAYLEERHFFWKFFDGKSFAIMAVMMTGGIGLAVERSRAGEVHRGVLHRPGRLAAAGRAAVRPQLRQSAPCRRRASK